VIATFPTSKGTYFDVLFQFFWVGFMLWHIIFYCGDLASDTPLYEKYVIDLMEVPWYTNAVGGGNTISNRMMEQNAKSMYDATLDLAFRLTEEQGLQFFGFMLWMLLLFRLCVAMGNHPRTAMIPRTYIIILVSITLYMIISLSINSLNVTIILT